MKIIFLDIDGVLNDHGRMMNIHSGIQKDKALLFNKVLDETDCMIVISSAWRYIILTGAMTIKGFEILLLTHGLKCHNRVIGWTPMDEEISSRGKQIQNWIDKYYAGKNTYVVVDDLDDGITECGHPFVHTDGKIGLTEQNVDQIIKLLS